MLLQGRVRNEKFPLRFGKIDAFGNPRKRDISEVDRTKSLRGVG